MVSVRGPLIGATRRDLAIISEWIETGEDRFGEHKLSTGHVVSVLRTIIMIILVMIIVIVVTTFADAFIE